MRNNNRIENSERYMHINFHKYQGTGNDFVMIDDRNAEFPIENQALVARLCDRKFGIGADGCILLRLHSEYAFEMVYFNADGRPATMCGNGGRCTVHFAHRLGLFNNETIFLAADGPHRALIEGDTVTLFMKDVEQVASQGTDFFLDTGSPHYVTFCENIETYNIVEAGRTIRYSEPYASQGGTNVNVVERIAPQHVKVRTYERGVEDETLSCGTGVTACALVMATAGASSPVRVETKGGVLEVGWEKRGDTYQNIYLKGAATPVFRGEISL